MARRETRTANNNAFMSYGILIVNYDCKLVWKAFAICEQILLLNASK